LYKTACWRVNFRCMYSPENSHSGCMPTLKNSLLWCKHTTEMQFWIYMQNAISAANQERKKRLEKLQVKNLVSGSLWALYHLINHKKLIRNKFTLLTRRWCKAVLPTVQKRYDLRQLFHKFAETCTVAVFALKKHYFFCHLQVLRTYLGRLLLS